MRWSDRTFWPAQRGVDAQAMEAFDQSSAVQQIQRECAGTIRLVHRTYPVWLPFNLFTKCNDPVDAKQAFSNALARTSSLAHIHA